MKINKKLTYISIAICHIVIITVAIFSAYTINKYIKVVQNEQVKKIEVIHKQLLKTGDINDIRDHADNIWRLYKARRVTKLSQLQFSEAIWDSIILLLLSEVIFILVYYINNKRSQRISPANR